MNSTLRIVFALLCFCMSLNLKAQPDYSMGYDDSGNRTALNVLIVKSSEIENDSIAPGMGTLPDDSSDNTFQDMNISGVKVFPNPTKGILKIKTDSEIIIDNGRIRVCNSGGIMVYNNQLKGRSAQVDLSGLPAGIYYMKIYLNPQQTSEWKIIKK